MIDWGLSAALVAIIAFVVTQVNEHKVKKLNDRVAQAEKNIDKLNTELTNCVLGIDEVSEVDK